MSKYSLVTYRGFKLSVGLPALELERHQDLRSMAPKCTHRNAATRISTTQALTGDIFCWVNGYEYRGLFWYDLTLNNKFFSFLLAVRHSAD